MSSQNLIIYKFTSLYNILEELGLDLNFNIVCIDNENLLNDKINNLNNFLIVSNKKNENLVNLLILNNLPINIFKLIEKINIEFLKLRFNNQSKMKINNYTIDLNSREMLINNNKIKLTEKEINIISYLSQVDKPISVNELQENVWSYQSDIETHTVETHIYRLRKKIKSHFSDNTFILNTKEGYVV